jgi:hypothetical protein
LTEWSVGLRPAFSHSKPAARQSRNQNGPRDVPARSSFAYTRK